MGWGTIFLLVPPCQPEPRTAVPWDQEPIRGLDVLKPARIPQSATRHPRTGTLTYCVCKATKVAKVVGDPTGALGVHSGALENDVGLHAGSALDSSGVVVDRVTSRGFDPARSRVKTTRRDSSVTA
jgi:hypothetical protein